MNKQKILRELLTKTLLCMGECKGLTPKEDIKKGVMDMSDYEVEQILAEAKYYYDNGIC